MKTNIRVRANGGSKSTSPQVPNKPDASVDQVETSMQFLERVNLFAEDRPDMEWAVFRALGLLELLGRMNNSLTRDKDHGSYQSIGFTDWAERIGKTLYDNWNAVCHVGKDAREVVAVRRLGFTVEKVKVLLLMMAHNLSNGGVYERYETAHIEGRLNCDDPDCDYSPYLTMATDCAEYLVASFHEDFGKYLPMDQFNRDWIENQIVAKFASRTEQRRAA